MTTKPHTPNTEGPAEEERYLVRQLVKGRSETVGAFAQRADAIAALDALSGLRWVWDAHTQRTICERVSATASAPTAQEDRRTPRRR